MIAIKAFFGTLFKSWYLYAYLLGLASGAWALNKFYVSDKVAEYEAALKNTRALSEKTYVNLEKANKEKREIISHGNSIENLKDYILDNRECDIDFNAERLLNLSATGLSTPTQITIARNSTTTDDQRISPVTETQLAEWCAANGTQYRLLKSNYDALLRWHRDASTINKE